MIKKLIVLVALLPLVFPVPSQARTGVEFLQDCESSSSIKSLACVEYLYGTWETLSSVEQMGWFSGFCMPDNVTVTQLKLIYIEWAKRNPAKLHYTASYLVLEALQEAFPCGQ